jgi:acid phosphatase type 7
MGARLVAGLALLLPALAAAEPFEKGPYLQRVTRTGITIMWQAQPPMPGTITLVAPDGAERLIEAPAAGIHEVRIEDLAPGRRYAYRVECGGKVAGGELVTAPEAHEPFSFVVFGDTRSNPAAHRTVVERIRREVPDFLLLTGDMVDDGSKESDWQTFFKVSRELLAENVVFPAVGNHDRHGRTRGADAYRRYFSLPIDTPAPERYYAFTYGNSRFIVLDSNEHSFALTDQTAWLEKELRQATADPAIAHRFVVMHHPPYSTSLHGGHPELREMWTPIFERYDVGAVFSGHDHTYEHAEKDGVRYFVSGGGGAPLYPKDPRAAPEDVAASIYFERTLHYLRVSVIGGFVEVNAIRADGSRIQTVSWGALPRRLVAEAAPRPAPTTPVQVAAPVPVRAPAADRAGCAVGGRGQGGAWLLILALGLARRRSAPG